MTNTTKNYNSIDSSNRTKIFKINFIPSSTTESKVSRLVDAIFNKIRDLSSRHLGYPTYFIANQEDTVIQKALKISGWVFGISPAILIMAYSYDALLDLYHQYFQKYSKLEECFDDKPKNPELLRINLAKKQPLKMKDCPEEEQENDTQIDIDLQNQKFAELNTPFDKKLESQTTKETELSDDDFTMIREIPAKSPTHQKFEIKSFPIIVDTREKTLENEEDNFMMIDHFSSEKLEEMKNTPDAPSGRMHRILQLWEKTKIFFSNPFNSKTWNILTPPGATQEDSKRFSFKDFEILDPIITGHNTTGSSKIYSTHDSLVQIKKDLGRNMSISVNGKQCHSLEEFLNQFPIQLNKDKTDILPNDNLIIPIILNFSNQTVLNFGFHDFILYNMAKISDYSLHIIQTDKKETQRHVNPTIQINWDLKSPEKMEIISESSVSAIRIPDCTPLATYKIRVKVNKDQTEVTWEALEELPIEPLHTQGAEMESLSVMVNIPEIVEKVEQSNDDITKIEDFEELESLSEDIKGNIINHNRDIALNHLLNKPIPA